MTTPITLLEFYGHMLLVTTVIVVIIWVAAICC